MRRLVLSAAEGLCGFFGFLGRFGSLGSFGFLGCCGSFGILGRIFLTSFSILPLFTGHLSLSRRHAALEFFEPVQHDVDLHQRIDQSREGNRATTQ